MGLSVLPCVYSVSGINLKATSTTALIPICPDIRMFIMTEAWVKLTTVVGSFSASAVVRLSRSGVALTSNTSVSTIGGVGSLTPLFKVSSAFKATDLSAALDAVVVTAGTGATTVTASFYVRGLTVVF
jgi:hypothetical protein